MSSLPIQQPQTETNNAKDQPILVTCALPYANGPIHLGHLLEHIQADIWVRFQKSLGKECLFICADDAHGTPIMLKAEQLAMTAEAMVSKINKEHKEVFSKFLIDYDLFGNTHSDENLHYCQAIFNKLTQNGYIQKKTILQAFDPEKQMFLPDRYVKGTCPKCYSADQYGDNCENCGATYQPTEMINPRSILSGKAPILKESEHYFFDLPQFENFLRQWIDENEVGQSSRNKLKEWFEQGLKPWDITRDAPYFGFLIPGQTDQYFYVWLDAPIGYISTFRQLCNQKGYDFDAFWQKDSAAKIYHFIGKDILYFHALFWPAVLYGSGFRTPTGVFTHGFMTVHQTKMSKSRGTFIEGSHYLEHLDPDSLRYYLASKLSHEPIDLDLNFEELLQKVNSDMVGKVANITSRCCKILSTHFENRLAKVHPHPLLEHIKQNQSIIAQAFERRNFQKAIRLISELADHTNQDIATTEPWKMVKNPELNEQTWQNLTVYLNAFYKIAIMLAPVVPVFAEQSRQLLQLSYEDFCWQNIDQPLELRTLAPFQPLKNRLHASQIAPFTSLLKT